LQQTTYHQQHKTGSFGLGLNYLTFEGTNIVGAAPKGQTE